MSKWQRREVVSEEEYNSTLSTIITRDFFSELPELQKQAVLLDRRAANDVEGAVSIRRAARRIQKMQEREQELEEQVEANARSNPTRLRQKPRPLHLESLSGFHARVTSEDNAEFSKLHQTERIAKEKYLELKYQKPLLIKQYGEGDDGGEPLASNEHDEPRVLKVQQVPLRNNLFCNPSAESNEVLSIIQTEDVMEREHLECNDEALMPPPSKVPKYAMMQYIPKYMLEKTIDPSQTRFPKKTTISQLASTTVARRFGQNNTAIVHHRDQESDVEPSDDDASTDLDSIMYNHRPLHAERQARLRRQQRELNTMISSPGISNVQIVGGGNAPFTMQQETHLSDERVAEESASADDSSFAFPRESNREKAAERAQTTLEERKRKATASRSNISRQRVSPRKSSLCASGISRKDVSSLSPAAMSLLSRATQKRNPLSVRSSSSFGSALRSSYTPPRVGSSNSRRSTGSSIRDHAYQATPQANRNGESEFTNDVTSMEQSAEIPKKSGSVTDGLLNLPL